MLLECYIKNGQGGENSLIHLVRISLGNLAVLPVLGENSKKEAAT